MKKKLAAIVAALLAFSPVAFSGCKTTPEQGGEYHYFQDMPKVTEIPGDSVEVYGYIMGTEAVLRVCDGDKFAGGAYEKAQKLWKDIGELLVSVNSSISVTVKSSYISAFNGSAAGAKVELDKTAYDVLSLAMRQYEATDGYYNPAVYYCSQIYGFKPDGVKKPEEMPSAEDTEAFRELAACFSEVTLTEENGRYYATKPQATVSVGGKTYSLAIDLGGIGKGWCTDRADELFAASGLSCGFFNFGSSSIAFKSNLSEDGAFNVAVRDPRSAGKPYLRFKAENEKLATSGDYEKYYEIDGVRYCHIIDPTTGAPITTGIASVTVVGGSAAENDAFTTALAAMGRERAEEFVKNKLDARRVVMLVFEDGNGRVITNCPDDMSVLNENYAFAGEQ